jgi:hypothetical protein
VSVPQLLAGRWSLIPMAPIVPRGDAAEVWTGKELIVWGGNAGSHGTRLFGDGAAYDPVTHRWRLLPTSPLTPRDGASAVWTGTEMVVFGGYVSDSPGAFRVSKEAAAYDPTNNRWTMLPPAPISARAYAIGMWTGRVVLVLGGQPAILSAVDRGYSDGATFDPTSDTWSRVSGPTPPSGHGIDWAAATQVGGQVFGFSSWYESQSLGNGQSSLSGGMDLFAYDLASATWRRVFTPSSAVPGPEDALVAGGDVIVRGAPYNCGPCPGPFAPEVTAFYDPSRGTWSRIAPDPLGGDNEISAWTGDALLSFDAGCQCGRHLPGSASLYDPAQARWQLLHAAPFGCGGNEPLIWTGDELLVYCPESLDAPSPAGLAYTPDLRSPRVAPIKIRVVLSRTRVVTGTSIGAVAIITNATGSEITLNGVCPHVGQWLAVGLTNANVQFLPLFTLPRCEPGQQFPPGISRYPITIGTTYQGCSELKTGATPQSPQCTAAGPPPLPPGSYVTKVGGFGLPSGTELPPPITVTLVAAHT